jgi:hypothetical protein
VELILLSSCISIHLLLFAMIGMIEPKIMSKIVQIEKRGRSAFMKAFMKAVAAAYLLGTDKWTVPAGAGGAERVRAGPSARYIRQTLVCADTRAATGGTAAAAPLRARRGPTRISPSR